MSFKCLKRNKDNFETQHLNHHCLATAHSLCPCCPLYTSSFDLVTHCSLLNNRSIAVNVKQHFQCIQIVFLLERQFAIKKKILHLHPMKWNSLHLPISILFTWMGKKGMLLGHNVAVSSHLSSLVLECLHLLLETLSITGACATAVCWTAGSQY